MGAANNVVVIDDLTGGWNATDPPLALAANECAQAQNVEWVRTKMGRRRHGTLSVETRFEPLSGPAAVFTTPIGSMTRHVPMPDEATGEVWAVDSTPVFGRKRHNSVGFDLVVPVDPLTGHAWDVTWATVDGELFVSYQSAVNRLHVWDGTTLRRTGIGAAVAAPVAADIGAGSFPAFLRTYRVRFYNAATLLVGEPSPGTAAFIPSGTGIAVRVTRPTAPGDGETHWILEASTDGATYYQLAIMPIALLYVDDSWSVADYSGAGVLSPLTGTFQLQKSYRFLAGGANRLLGFGTFADPPNYQNRVEISDIVNGGTLGVIGFPAGHPAEYINTTAGWYVDLDESDSGPAMGLKGPVFDNYYAFKARQLWELRPTGNSARPFAATAISKTIGTVAHQSIVVGEDWQGQGCLYWWSHKGPYRYSVQGLEYIGHKLEGFFKESSALDYGGDVNLDAAIRVAHGVYYSDNRQVWWWVATGAAHEPTVTLIYHTENGGWSRFTGMAPARCSAMLPDRQVPTMSRVRTPHFAPASIATAVRIIKADQPTTPVDVGPASYTSLLMTRPVLPGGPAQMGHVGDVQIVARAQPLLPGEGATLTLETFPNLAIPTGPSVTTATQRVTTANLRQVVAEDELQPWVFRRFEDSGLDEALCASYRVRDNSAARWVIDRLLIPVRPQGAVTT